MNTQQPSRPVITPAMREQAKKQPNTWLYVVDPIFTDPNAEVPPWGFIGGYRVDEQGEITDDFSPNPNYRPSPVALRLPAPTNDVERALQLTTTGYAQGQALLAAMLDSELILFAQPQGSGLFTMEHESGRRQLQVFTSDGFLPPNWTTWQRMTGRQLAANPLAGVDLQINPTSPVKARMPGEDLVRIAASVPPKPAGVPMSPPAGTPVAPGAPVPPGPPVSPPAGTPMSPPAGAAVPPAPPTPAPAVPVGPATPAVPTTPAGSAAPADPAETEFGRRFLGSMLAGAIGDALGAPVEFYPIDQIRSRFGDDGVTEYDRNAEHPGEFTDDTQLTLFTLEGLIRAHSLARSGDSAGPLPAVQLAYQRWLHTQGYAWMRSAGPFAAKHPKANGWLVEQSDLFAVRSPNSSSISALREFASVGAPGTFERPINDSDDCGGVVRAAPVALWSDDARSVFELAAATAALTHSQPNAYLPAGVLAVLVHRLLREESLESALAQARELLTSYRSHEDTERALQAAVDLAAKGKPTPEQVKDVLGSGWSGHEALAIAVCAALSTDTIADALMIAINHSGDSDSTAAICGNIVGARHGAAALPGVWLRDLRQREVVESLAKDGLLEFRGTPPTGDAWAKRYPAAGDVSDLDFAASLPRAEAPAPDAADTSGDETPSQTPEAETAEAAPQESPEPVVAAPEVASVVSPPESAAPAPPTSPEDLRTQRILGMLLGTAAGDALGFPIEADSLAEIRAKYGDSGLIDYVDGHRPAGSISDETQLTAFTTEGLIRASTARRLHGSADPAVHVQQAYQRWLHTQGIEWAEAGGSGEQPDGWLIDQRELFDRRVRGMTTMQALRGFAGGHEQGSLDKPPNDAADWGAVTRSAPAALWSDDPGEAFRTGVRTALLTHGHASAYLPAGALALLVHQLLANRSLPQAVDRALIALSEWDGHEETITALRKAVELAATGTPTPEQIEAAFGTAHSGAQVLAIAVCAALTHPESFPDALVLAANHSGASDSTAAICGGIMGAAHTATAIPPHWQEKLELRETLEFLAADADLEFGPKPSSGKLWAARYPVPEERPEDAAEETPEPVVAEEVPAEAPAVEEAAVAEAPAAEAPAAEAPQEPAAEKDSDDDGLSDEELRLLLAWRKFRDNDEGGANSELSQGLHKLLAEAFGEERAAQLVGEAAAEEETPDDETELAEEEQVRPSRHERITGCVLGTAVGDALGAPWMFSDLLTTLRENPDGVREYAELFGRRGTGTVYAQQTAFVLSGLTGENPDKPSLVRASLRDWVRTQGGRPTPDGRGKLAESDVLCAQRFPDEATLTAMARWGDRAENPTPGNPPNDARNAAAAARGAVVGFQSADPAEAVELGARIGVLTHGHPDGYLPAAALAGLVSGLDGGRTLIDSAQAVLAELDRMEGAENTARGLRAAVEIATSGPVSPTVLESLGLGWHAPEALAIAVAAALSHPNSVSDAVSLAATHAGNSAATAAICGALMGTARGAGELPPEWLEQLELRELLERLLAEADTSEVEAPEPVERPEPVETPEPAAQHAG